MLILVTDEKVGHLRDLDLPNDAKLYTYNYKTKFWENEEILREILFHRHESKTIVCHFRFYELVPSVIRVNADAVYYHSHINHRGFQKLLQDFPKIVNRKCVKDWVYFETAD